MVYVAKTPPDEGDLFTGTRVCTKCERRLPMDNFSWAGRERKIRFRGCKSCLYSLGKKNKTAIADVPGHKNPTYLRKNYGVTVNGIAQLIADQHNECAICKRDLTDNMQIDHCHDTGVVRGLLCFQCNSGLGKFYDDAGHLKAAAEYLERKPPSIESSIEPTPEEVRAERQERVKRSWETRRRSSVQVEAGGV